MSGNKSKMSKIKRLEAIGFVYVGDWKASDSPDGILEWSPTNECPSTENVLYAFVIDDDVKYIGKSVKTLKHRMRQYQKPGPTQSRNVRNNGYILNELGRNKKVNVYALPDNGLLYYGEFHLNLAAGLEDSLIKLSDPPWNGGKKENEAPPAS
jgi:hypothetical protein